MLIGLVGYARSGKDTVANFLTEKHNFTRVAFADQMREALVRLDPKVNVGSLYGTPLTSALKHFGWEGLKKESEDVRHLLQRMGTEVGREMFGEDVWVNRAMALAIKNENTVFSDVRFHNEADAILRAGGRLWKVERPGVGPVNEHISDSAMDSYQKQYFDLKIINDSTKEDLYVELADAMSMMKAHNGN